MNVRPVNDWGYGECRSLIYIEIELFNVPIISLYVNLGLGIAAFLIFGWGLEAKWK